MDFFLFLVFGCLLFLAYLLYLQEVLTPYLTDTLVTAENSLITMLFFLKFLLALCVYKNTDKGNSKENTLLIYMIRVLFDFVVIGPALFYLQYYQNWSVWHLVNYGAPLAVSELCIYMWSVRDAIAKTEEKERRR